MQEIMKEWLAGIYEAGIQDQVYSGINSAANYTAWLFGIWHGRKLRMGFLALLLVVFLERQLTGMLASAVLFVENGFKPTTIANGVVGYPYIPLVGLLIAKIIRRPWKEVWDVMMPIPLVMFAGARVACTAVGCCYGYPCSWGVYNVNMREYLFPIQLLEGLAAILILVAVIRREKKNHFVPDGRNVPIVLISYGIARFFLEFFHDNKKIGFGIASTQIHCLIMILMGIITLAMIRKSEASHNLGSPKNEA